MKRMPAIIVILLILPALAACEDAQRRPADLPEHYIHAIDAARAIDEERDRSQAFHAISISLARSGHVEGCSYTMQYITIDRLRDQVMLDKIVAMSREDMFDAALSKARQLRDPENHATAMHRIVVAQAYLGKYDTALRMVRDEEEHEIFIWKNRAKHDIAIAYAEAGFFDEAIALANTAGIGWQAQALGDIARMQAKPGYNDDAHRTFADALTVTNSLARPRTRALLQSMIAKNMALAGFETEARDLFEQALEVIQKIDDANVMADALYRHAAYQADAGFFEASFQAAHHIDSWYEAQKALSHLAIVAAGQDHIERALAVANQIEDVRLLAQAMHKIAIAHARAEAFDVAMQLTETIGDDGIRMLTWRSIAMMQAEQGSLEDALASAEKITPASVRVGALREITKVWAGKENHHDAATWASALTDPYEQAYAWLGIAEGIAGHDTAK